MANDALDEIYDLRGLNCPLPVLKTRKKLAGMKPGTLLKIETTDPLASIDVPAFCNESGHELVEVTARDGGHLFVIRRGRNPAG